MRNRDHEKPKNRVPCDLDYTSVRGVGGRFLIMWNVKTATITMIVCAVALYYNIDRINALLW